ncbi:hypothetical protein IKQ26_09725 [bacterium]|nr:hypothetical protein [bacterium]
MEVSAIQNSPMQHQKQVKRNNILTSALSGAGIGAAINGFQSFSQQKQLLKNGDAFIKNMTEEIAQITEPELKQQAEKVAQATTDFIKAGKINLKAIGINALKGALMFGIVFAGVEVISNAIRNAKAKKQAKQV